MLLLVLPGLLGELAVGDVHDQAVKKQRRTLVYRHHAATRHDPAQLAAAVADAELGLVRGVLVHGALHQGPHPLRVFRKNQLPEHHRVSHEVLRPPAGHGQCTFADEHQGPCRQQAPSEGHARCMAQQGAVLLLAGLQTRLTGAHLAHDLAVAQHGGDAQRNQHGQHHRDKCDRQGQPVGARALAIGNETGWGDKARGQHAHVMHAGNGQPHDTAAGQQDLPGTHPAQAQPARAQETTQAKADPECQRGQPYGHQDGQHEPGWVIAQCRRHLHGRHAAVVHGAYAGT